MTDQDTNASFSPIPTLQKLETVSVHKDKDIVEVLQQTFFTPLPEYEAPEKHDSSEDHQLPMHKVTEKEVQEAIFRASPFKGAGLMGIPAVVWQKTWPVIKGALLALFRASVNQGKLPDKWRIAKIIPLRKPQKGNYKEPESFRPISLLPTPSKALESVIA